MSHQWLPTSPCGDGCTSRTGPRAGRARIGLRYLRLVVTVSILPVMPAAAVLPGRWRRALYRGYARTAVSSMGLHLVIRDERSADAEPGRGVLAVAGHVSWLDVLVLSAVEPGDFVARADLLGWPLLGRLARWMRVLPIDRVRLRELPGVVDEAAERLRVGGRVVAFPEGTTWCGRAYGRLRPAMFQAAIDSGAVVAPIGLRYLRPDGGTESGIGFVGDQSLVTSLRRTVALRQVRVEVRLVEHQEPGADRRELAARCEGLIRGDQDTAIRTWAIPDVTVVAS